MDILDILVAKKKSFTGETEKLVHDANAAMAKANEVTDKISEAEDLLGQAQSVLETANQANETAQEAASDLENIKSDVTDAATEVVSGVKTELEEKIETVEKNAINEVTIEEDNNVNYKGKKIRTRKKQVNNAYNIVKNYTTTGANEDGSMTQKAITEELNKISQSGGSGGNTNLGQDNSGKMVVVGSDGNIKAGTVSEENVIETLINSGNYEAKNAVGLEIDYVNKGFSRTQEAANLAQGADFDKFTMYGGRRRCIVNSNGKIIAWYGDSNYIEDGSLGQVMVYQPKFYYSRAILSSNNTPNGKVINKESLIISATEQAGFKLHPMFRDENGEEIDYVLFPAYESTYQDVSENKIVLNDATDVDFTQDKLMSIAGAKPISGINKQFTVENAERMAQNIGNGWHITNMAFESANQMLQMIEFGRMNGQLAFEAGIVNINSNSNVNGASITGSTSSLGNVTGAANSTVNELNGSYTEYSEPGYRAISYRGMENPWGNIYRFIGGINIYSDGTLGSGVAYIASNYNYTPNTNGSNYHNIGYQLSNSSSWISSMGYGSIDYDWVYLPITAENASSLVPVGDFVWIDTSLNGINTISIGGTQRQGDNCGMFYYACDQKSTKYSASQSARIMHIPTKGSATYESNIASWRQQIGA